MERGRQIFELLAYFLADSLADLAAAGTGLFGILEVVLDLDAGQALGQGLAAVVVAIPDQTHDHLVTRLFGDARLVERHRVDLESEEQELARVEPLGLRPVGAAQDGGDRGLVLGLHPQPQGLELFGGLLPDVFDEPIALDERDLPLHEQSLEQDRVVGKVVDVTHDDIKERYRVSRWPEISKKSRVISRRLQAGRVAATVKPESSGRSWPLSMATALSSPAGKRNVRRSSRLS